MPPKPDLSKLLKGSSGALPAFLACSSSNCFHKGFSGVGTWSVWRNKSNVKQDLSSAVKVQSCWSEYRSHTDCQLLISNPCKQAGVARVPYLISCFGLRIVVFRSCTFTPIAGASSRSCLSWLSIGRPLSLIRALGFKTLSNMSLLLVTQVAQVLAMCIMAVFRHSSWLYSQITSNSLSQFHCKHAKPASLVLCIPFFF